MRRNPRLPATSAHGTLVLPRPWRAQLVVPVRRGGVSDAAPWLLRRGRRLRKATGQVAGIRRRRVLPSGAQRTCRVGNYSGALGFKTPDGK